MPRYEQDSIVEALCEFMFEPTTLWDPTVFGRFIAELGEIDYPHREVGEVVGFGLVAAGGGVVPHTEHQPRMRFFNTDRTRLAQVGAHLVAANVLRPYPHWQEMRDFVLRVLEAYRRAASPQAIARMTLRYIDRIELTSAPAVLGDWFEAGSDFVPGFLRDAGPGAFSRVSKQSGQRVDAVTIALDASSIPALMLDTELVVLSPVGSQPALSNQLDELHARVNAIFESSITDKTRRFLRVVHET